MSINTDFYFLIERSPPGKLLYLDCEEVDDNVFELSFGWPDSGKDNAPSSETTHAVVECRVGDQWTRIADKIKESPYIAHCKFYSCI